MMGYHHQKGLSLVELMVALVLSLFLLTGVITIFINTKVSYSAQQALAALQENQRLASTVLGNTIQQAGYFPYNSTTPTNKYAFPANNTFALAGQVIYGTNSTIKIRFVTAPNDGLINCNGGSNTGSIQYSVTDIISLNSSQDSLECAVGTGKPQPIVSPLGSQAYNPNGGGISSMQVLYGVAPQGSDSVDQYLNASQVQSKNEWMQVHSVLITLDFVNPMYDPNHVNGQPQTLKMTQVINLRNLAR